MTFPLSGSSRDIFRYFESAETGTNSRLDFASISTSPGLPPSSGAADAEKQAAILKAEAERQAAILKAEGEAQAILNVQQALADSIKMLNEANPNEQVIKIKALESFEKAADGQATKIIVPSEIQSLAGLAASFKGLLEDEKK